jgi:hypothetical protein
MVCVFPLHSTQSPPGVVRKGPKKGEATKTKPRSFGTTDPMTPIVEHIALFLLCPRPQHQHLPHSVLYEGFEAPVEDE